jgi:hypothetical protein
MMNSTGYPHYTHSQSPHSVLSNERYGLANMKHPDLNLNKTLSFGHPTISMTPHNHRDIPFGSSTIRPETTPFLESNLGEVTYDNSVTAAAMRGDLDFDEVLKKKNLEQQVNNTKPRLTSKDAGNRDPYERGRGSSYDHRRMYKFKGFDPKAKMIKQLKKDAKKIDEILQYKDYSMEYT